MAILHGAAQVNIVRVAQASFDGIRIEGLLQRNPVGFIWPDRKEDF